ncbi:MAG: FKBP-type peptidyl-prolyl cis-trans isomerase [Bacteroidetes bacterium]|nr:FKBP-type peptidyl-prolyl cis-trans isomerase [Bacteroidota bacterium]
MQTLLINKDGVIRHSILLLLMGLLLPLGGCLDDAEDYEKKEEEEIKEYIENNDITVQPTESGLYYIETKEGDGRQPVDGDSVIVNYIRLNLTGYVLETNIESVAMEYSIWSSYVTYAPFGFLVGSTYIIDGWNEGIKFMKVGGEATLLLPSSLALQNYQPMLFEITLIDVFSPNEETELLEQYILENNITTEAKESGLYYIETEAGTGLLPQQGDTVDVHYTGRLVDSTVFDTSVGGDPFSFALGTGYVIPGWDEGIAYMKEGGKATIIIPSVLGYGSSGSGSIPPYSTLIFDVELVDVR